MKFGVVVFPGSNCDADCYHVLKNVFGQETVYIWHKDADFKVDCIVLPGGFSYGDYLRAGAIARFSPVMKKVIEFSKAGGLVIGICNGFQILLEAGLLPGAMLRNKNLNFRCQDVYLRVENTNTPFTHKASFKQVLKVPIAHGEGNYYCEPETLKQLQENGQIVFRYCDREGEVTPKANPNGALDNIAGIINEKGNVLGMMPHPERCSEKLLGGEDGKIIWESIIAYLEGRGGRG